MFNTDIPLFPYGPYGLYTASVSVKCSFTSILPLWALGLLQNLSACTVQLCLYSTYGPYGPHSASVPVQ